jgi:integrase-like protein
MNVRRDILHPIRERLAIPRGGFHAFRHGLGTALMPEGVNPRVVQAQLGHADLRMLQRYAHVVSEDQRTAVERTTEIFLRRSAANAGGKSLRIIEWLAYPTGFEPVLLPLGPLIPKDLEERNQTIWALEEVVLRRKCGEKMPAALPFRSMANT